MKQIHSVTEFLEIVTREKQNNLTIDEPSDLIFRGQNVAYKLEPKLTRYKHRDVLNLEKLIIKEFKRLSPPLVSIDPTYDADWFVLAQHYGLPTMLLDWTYNPLSALWFAINMVKQKGRGAKDKASVWILKPSLEDFQKQQFLTIPIDKVTETIIYRPRNVTARIVNQSSIFTLHQIAGGVVLEEDDNYKEKLVQCRIDTSAEDSILENLHVLNVNRSTIYPDLEGLCGHLKWRYFERPKLTL